GPPTRAVARQPATTRRRRSPPPALQLARSRVSLPAQRDADVASPEGHAGQKVGVNQPFLIIDNSAVIGTQHALIHALELAARYLEVAEIGPHAQLTEEPHEACADVPPGVRLVQIDIAVTRRRIAVHLEPSGSTGDVRSSEE